MATQPVTGDATSLISGAALSWLALDLRARIIIGIDLEVIWANVAAREMLDKSGEIMLRDGQLAFARPAGERAFVGFVDGLGAKLTSLALIDPSQTEEVLLSGHAVETDNGWLACIELAGHAAAGPRYHDLVSIFGPDSG